MFLVLSNMLTDFTFHVTVISTVKLYIHSIILLMIYFSLVMLVLVSIWYLLFIHSVNEIF